MESYQERYEVKEIYRQKSKRTVAPRIKVKIVRSFVDEKMKYGKELTIENGEKLVDTAIENMSKVVPVVLLSAQVRSHGLGFCNKTCQRYALTRNGIIRGFIFSSLVALCWKIKDKNIFFTWMPR